MVSREPKHADAHALLGASLVGAGKPEEAISMLEKALSLNPDGPGWYAGSLAVARAFTGQPEEATTTLQEALSLDPDNAQIYRYLSLVLSYEGKHEESLSMAKNAVSLKKKTPGPVPDTEFYLTLGLSHLMMEQYEEAIAAFKKAIRISTEYVYAHIGLTASYSMAGRMEEARAEAAEVLRINPKITLEDIAKNGYLNYKKADKKRFINALRKAGLK